MDEYRVARGLGWFSIGLGLVEAAAPKRLGAWLGMADRATLLRLYGLREITNGIGLLAQQAPGRPAPWLWGRVGGDVMDIVTLLAGLLADNPKRANVGIALGAVGGITLADVWCARRAGDAQRRKQQDAGTAEIPGTVARTLSIGLPADELHRLWRRPETLRAVMAPFAEVSAADEERAHWSLRGPKGKPLVWDTRVVEDRPGEVVRWESVDGAKVPNGGSIRFRPAPEDWGTEATLELRFEPPGGLFGAAAASLLRAVPVGIAGQALHRFKSLAETGEIPTLERNPSGRDHGRLGDTF